MTHQAGAMEDTNDFDGAQAANRFDDNTEIAKVAQAAIDYRQQRHQTSDMESVKALLRNFLDDINEVQTERSPYFDGLLSQWLDIWRKDRTHSLLIYVLGDRSEHYGNRMLDFDDLETIDRIKTRFLEQHCSEQGICLHLAKMTSAVNIDPRDNFELKMAMSLYEIRDLTGRLLSNKPVALGIESFLQKSMFNERYHQRTASQNPYPSPTDGTQFPYIDNAKSFQDWVLLIMPEGYRFKFLTENAEPQALHDWINTQLVEAQSSEMDLARADPNVRWGLTLACKNQLNNINTWLVKNFSRGNKEEDFRQADMLKAIVRASLSLQDLGLFQNAITLSRRMLELSFWEEVGSMMDLGNFFSYQKPVNQALQKIHSFQDRYIVLHDIRIGCASQNPSEKWMDEVHSWIQEQLKRALNEIYRVEENDGAVLVLVARKYGKAITMNRIISFAKKHSSNQAFAIEFAFSLYDELVANTMDPGFAAYGLAEILSATVPAICVPGAHGRSLYQGSTNPAYVNAPVEDQQMLQADRMARLVRCCLTVGLHDEEYSLLRHMWLAESEADAPTLQHVFLPYLKNLLKVMQDYSIPLTTQTYQWQFQQVIPLFITRYIGKEPPPLPPDLTCPPLGCASPKTPYGCSTCLKLDAFLVDPHRKTADITGGIDAPEHVSAQIQGTDHLQMKVMTHSSEHMTSTIRITKNLSKPEEPDARHELWKERVFKANDLIQAVCGDEEWKMLLGHMYDECMGLDAVRI